jgi:DNA ligase (NAD+)
MNIDKVGDKIIESLCAAGLLSRFSDFYTLKKEDLLSLERQGEKSVQNILTSIEKSKHPTLARLIFSFGIRFVGEQTAKTLAEHFVSLENFLSANAETLVQVPDVGPKVAQSIVDWLSNKTLVADARKLIKLGVSPSEPTRNLTGPLAEKSFLITGTLPVGRDVAKSFIEAQGGKILSSVSSKLSYLVVGNEPGSKLEKAQSLGVKIISWDELLEITGGR